MTHRSLKRFLTAVSWTLVLIVILAPVAWFAISTYLKLRPKQNYILSSGTQDGVYYPLGEDLRQIFSKDFPTRVEFQNTESPGALENLKRIQNGDVQLGLTQDGMTLEGYVIPSHKSQQPTSVKAFTNVRVLAQLYKDPLQIIVRRNTVKDLAGLKGKRIFPGLKGSGTLEVTRYVLERYGMNLDCVPVKPCDFEKPEVTIENWDQAAKALIDGKIDAGFFVIGYDVPLIKKLAETRQFDLLSIDRTKAIVAALPSFEYVEIPRGAYATEETFPSTTIETINIREVLVCASTLSDKDAYQIVEALFRSPWQLAQHFPLLNRLSQIDQERNLYYEPHKGALDFYRGNPKPSIDVPKLISFLTATISLATSVVLFRRWRRARRIRLGMLELSTSTERAESRYERLAQLFATAQSEYFHGKIPAHDFNLISSLRDHIEPKSHAKGAGP